MLLDTNILLYAFRKEYAEHEPTRRWINGLLTAGERIVLHPLVSAAFLRLTTRQLGPVPAAPIETVLGFLAVIENAGGRTSLAETTGHIATLGRLCSRHAIRADGIVDAWLAAFAITHRLRLASHDKGFARFTPELDWLDPLAAD